MSGWEDFRHMTAWEEDRLRDALQADDPRLRVRAAWALGLRLEGNFASTAREAIAAEPLPGVRRHWLVMLTGFGEVDIVAALARHDPDDDVRTTAARFVGELACAHRDAYALVVQLIGDHREGVRASVVDGLRAEVPPEVAVAIEGLRDDPSIRVREAVSRWDVRELDLVRLRQSATTDPDSSVRRAAIRGLLETVGMGPALQGVEPPQIATLVRDLDALGQRVAFDDIPVSLRSASWLAVMDIDRIQPAGRLWLLSLDWFQVPDYWNKVARAYTSVATITDPEEAAAVRIFVQRIEDTLAAGDDAPLAQSGSIAVRGNWSAWESPRRRLLDILRERLD